MIVFNIPDIQKMLGRITAPIQRQIKERRHPLQIRTNRPRCKIKMSLSLTKEAGNIFYLLHQRQSNITPCSTSVIFILHFKILEHFSRSYIKFFT